MWFLRCLPITLPLLPITTAVFQIDWPWASSRSRIGDTITMLCLSAIRLSHCVERPSSADSAKSVHGSFSRVQKANGIVHASWKQSTFVPAAAAASMNSSWRSCSAWYCSSIGADVGARMQFCVTPKRTIRGSRDSAAAPNLWSTTSKSPFAASAAAAGGSGSSATGAPAFSPYIAPITLRCASGGRCSASRCSTLWNSDGSESGPGEVAYSGVNSSAAVESAARRGERRAARRERGPVRRESISFLEWEAAWTEMSWKFGTQL